MHELRSSDPADVVIAWEAVEELIAVVPEGAGKDVLRLIAAGFSVGEIGTRLRLPAVEVVALAARARMRVLTAALTAGPAPA